MALNPSNSSNFEHLALKGLTSQSSTLHISSFPANQLTHTKTQSSQPIAWLVQQQTKSNCNRVNKSYRKLLTSNVTARHRGLKRKLQAGCRALSPQRMLCCDYFSSSSVVSCALCTMRAFEVRASSSSPMLPLCQIQFLLQPPLLSQPMEKNRVLNQSNQSINLFDAPETSETITWFLCFAISPGNGSGLHYIAWGPRGLIYSQIKLKQV